MKTSTKVLSVIAGILLITAGIWSFFSPFKAFIALEIVCGILLIVTGIIRVTSYFIQKKDEFCSGWVLFEGIISILCGAVFCFSQYSVEIFAITISVALGIWLMFMGVSQCSLSMQLKSLGTKGWGWITALGIICIICSISSFFHPVIAAVGTQSFLMGFLFITGGISLISNCLTRK